LKTSGAVTSVLFPFWFLFTKRSKEERRKRKKQNSLFYFISLIPCAPYSNWSWCALDGRGNWCDCEESKSAKRRRRKGDRAPILFLWPARLIYSSLFFLFDTFDDIHIKE
jgi:hypothetical protein